jgi:hypothetical protein
MSIQSVGHTLYVALFGGIGRGGPEVVSFPVRPEARPTPVLTGFAAPVVALGIDGGRILTGDSPAISTKRRCRGRGARGPPAY